MAPPKVCFSKIENAIVENLNIKDLGGSLKKVIENMFSGNSIDKRRLESK